MSGSTAAKTTDGKAAQVVAAVPSTERGVIAGHANPHPVATLQRTAGNAAVRGLLTEGRPLDLGIRGEMEERFGRDFGDVRLHTGPAAESAAATLGAKAFTIGGDIAFGADRYALGTATGKTLLAHELAHVVQQRGSHAPPGAAATAESDARQAASAAADGAPASVQATAPTGAVQLEPVDHRDDWMDAWKRQHPAEPKLLSRAWVAELNAGSPAEEKARQEQLAKLQASANPDITHRLPPKPPDQKEMKVDQAKLRDFANEQFEANQRAEAVRAKNRAAEEVQKRKTEAAEEERTGFGPAGPSAKRQALEGSPVLAIQEQLEGSFQSKAEIDAFRKHVSTISPEEFYQAYPGMSPDIYLALHDFGQIGQRRWENFVQPPAEYDAMMRRALKLGPRAYLSQAHQDALADAIVNGRKRDVATEFGLSPAELDRLSGHFKRTHREGVYVDKDPLIIAQGYSGRESGYGSFLMRQRLEDLAVLASSPAAGIGYGGASLVTDDEATRMRVARAGATLEGVVMAGAGVAAGRQHMSQTGRSVSEVNQVVDVAPGGSGAGTRGPAPTSRTPGQRVTNRVPPSGGAAGTGSPTPESLTSAQRATAGSPSPSGAMASGSGSPVAPASPTTPTATPASAPPRKRGSPRRFLNEQRAAIRDKDHDLHSLLVPRLGKNGEPMLDKHGNPMFAWRTTTRVAATGRVQTGRYDYQGHEEGAIVQVGDTEAFAYLKNTGSTQPQTYALEDAGLNQATGRSIESRGAYSLKERIAVTLPDGTKPAWVEVESLKHWERTGAVPPGTYERAVKSQRASSGAPAPATNGPSSETSPSGGAAAVASASESTPRQRINVDKPTPQSSVAPDEPKVRVGVVDAEALAEAEAEAEAFEYAAKPKRRQAVDRRRW